ncbi:RHS repeat-associated core domain-containing protein [Rhodocyclus gracilis]|uniref:RHS repeat-associated core domain-containing protein n=1 Tax=Rhodocyclus gracilis TaxID=2929842 RepID=UPI001E30CB68|nr:RHS repeat-associated core domain-containing protein [Rhodocyclus gracilis]
MTHRYKNGASYDVRDVITRTFDAADRVKTETDAEGNTTSYSYDDAGNVIAVTDAEGHTTRFEYDPMNRKTAVIDATGYRTETILTLRGDVIGITNANDEKVTFEIDALGRKTAAIDAKGYRSEFQYDENGNLTCAIDANAQAGLQPKNSFGCSESRQYDELNRVTRIIDALNGETSFTYDLAGNRLTVKDAEAKTWSFAYDDLGRLSSETDHSAKTISYKPDEAGNIYEKTNRLNEVTRYTFDNGNRLTRVDYLKDGSAETFGYDAAGNRNAAANSVVSYAFNWDRLNRLSSKVDSRGKSMSFTYDKVGNILTKTTYQGSATSYVYNAANRLVMLQNPDYTQVDYQYDPAGRLLSRVTANGARMTQQFDANGWLTRLDQYDATNALVSSTTYTRDRVGNITGQTDASGTTTFALDALYRLSTADYPGTTNDELFSYDKVGNRKTYTKGSLTPNADTRYYNYTAGTNRLAETRIGSSSGTLESGFTNDLEGRLTVQTGLSSKTLSWDGKGRVKTLNVAGRTETYAYDPMDYRIGRRGGSLGNRDYFLEGEHLESEYAGGQLQARYFRGSGVDELVAAWMYDSDSKLQPFLFHHDHVTSVTAVSGHNGGTTQSVKYSAFGVPQSTTGSSPNRLKYTGREEDGTGLYYYRARYYDPAIGRFISEDPKGFDAGINFLSYVRNNPINAADPSGLVDVIYSPGPLSQYNPITANQSQPGRNYMVADSYGATYPMGSGTYQRTVVEGRPFDVVIGPDQTGNIVNWGVSHIQNNRLLGSSGDASMAELAWQSLPGHAWDTKQYLPYTSTFIINGKAEQRDYVGNAIWAAGVKSLGVSESTALWGARAQGSVSGVGHEDVRDQEAIKFGYSWPGYAPTTSISPAPSAPPGASFLDLSAPGAYGGFLLYPNKPNNNFMASVYAK